ncbi:MAG TPA: hypothetical protein VN626_05590 [Clostridia bacterium]|nr:hypothetical protein [Clostridia bacterium]
MKHIMCGLLVVVLTLLPLFGCSSTQSNTPRLPISSSEVFAAVSAPTSVQENVPPEIVQSADVDASAAEALRVTVYITETGSKYHCSGCTYLAKSCISIELETAKQSYGPCSKCHPPI